MASSIVSRRSMLQTLAALAASGMAPRPASAAPADLRLPPGATEERFDLEAHGIDDWIVVNGRWVVEEVGDAPRGKRVLMQRATGNEFNVIVAPVGPFSDVDVSVMFKPISGKEDASGGIVVRFDRGRYYVARANALEDNIRLYYFDRGRHQLASARVKPPSLGTWHTLRLQVIGDRLQTYLDGTLHLDRRDTRFGAGRVGLWTKADSITAFDDLVIRGVVSER